MVKWSELWRSLIGGLRLRLLLLVALVSAPFVGLILHTAYEDRRQAKTAWAERAITLGQQMGQHETKLIASTRQLLIAMAESAPVRAASQRAAHSLIEHLEDSYPLYSNLGVIKANGDVLASIQPLTDTNLLAELEEAIHTNTFSIATFPGSNGVPHS